MPRYTVKKRLVSIGRDYDVEDENGELALKLDGKLRFARTFLIKDRNGERLLSVREKLLCLDPTFVITSARQPIAVVRRITRSATGTATFEIEMDGGIAMKAHGSFLREGIEIKREGAFAGSVSREPNRVIHEIFHVSVGATEDPALLLAIAMSIVETDLFRGEDRSEG
jgi:uncharacterized protein YxjI